MMGGVGTYPFLDTHFRTLSGTPLHLPHTTPFSSSSLYKTRLITISSSSLSSSSSSSSSPLSSSSSSPLKQTANAVTADQQSPREDTIINGIGGASKKGLPPILPSLPSQIKDAKSKSKSKPESDLSFDNPSSRLDAKGKGEKEATIVSNSTTSSSNGGIQQFRRTRRSIHDYMKEATGLLPATAGGPPRWFSPIDCDGPPSNAPLLLFLPGLDGTGLGLILHHQSLGKLFEVWCLHIPVTDRTPFEGLIAIVESVFEIEKKRASPRPIYLVGDSLGGALALSVAARNPNIDLILVLANPATSFSRSQLQPLFPLLEVFPSEAYNLIPFTLSFIMGDPIKMAFAKVDSKVSEQETRQQLSDSLVSLIPMLPLIADIVPKETLDWKLKLVKSAAMHANSRLHAIQAEVLILASGKDNMLPSLDEAKRLKKILKKCCVRHFKDSGHTLLMEDGIDLATTIKGTQFYRTSQKYDFVSDFVPPTVEEYEKVNEEMRFFLQWSSPVFLSKARDGEVVKGLPDIPLEQPILLVGNHMLMGLELTAIVSEFLKEKNRIVRGIAHPALFTRQLEADVSEPGFNDYFTLFGAVPATRKSFIRILSRQESALLYPGGAREALHRKGEAYKLFWPEHSEFVRAAARYGITIVPFGCVGEDDILELLLDYDELVQIPPVRDFWKSVNDKIPRMRTGETGEVAKQDLHFPILAPKLPSGRIYVMFGKAFHTAGMSKELQNREKANEVYLEVKKEVESCLEYLLEKREKDPYRSVIPRALSGTFSREDWRAPTFDI